MPWNNQNGGGGWQGGGGRGPWGQQPGPGGGGGNQPPDLDELFRRGQDRFKQVFPGGSKLPLLIGGLAILAILLSSSIYRVDTDEEGVVTRFGKYVRSEAPGLHLKLPYPIEAVQTPKVTTINEETIGTATIRGNSRTDIARESLMLTGDENIVDIDFSVFWRINNAPDYLFNVENQRATVKALAESAMREVVGKSSIQTLQTSGRTEAQTDTRELMQKALDDYKAGVFITEVRLAKVDPPAAVIDAFRDVQAARADQERLRNEAEAYANTVVPQARGEAEQITQSAEAYREQSVAEAEGQAQRFTSIYEQYKNAPDVTRRRLYLETMEEVLGSSSKLVTEEGGTGVLPYLPLEGLTPKAGGSNRSSSNSGEAR